MLYVSLTVAGLFNIHFLQRESFLALTKNLSQSLRFVITTDYATCVMWKLETPENGLFSKVGEIVCPAVELLKLKIFAYVWIICSCNSGFFNKEGLGNPYEVMIQSRASLEILKHWRASLRILYTGSKHVPTQFNKSSFVSTFPVIWVYSKFQCFLL